MEIPEVREWYQETSVLNVISWLFLFFLVFDSTLHSFRYFENRVCRFIRARVYDVINE